MNESVWRLIVFAGVYLLCLVLELILRHKTETLKEKGWRWVENWGLVLLSTGLTRLLFPLGLVGVAESVAARDWGLFQWLDIPVIAQWVLTVVLMDFAIYGQHVVTHHVPWLWRLHRVHHSDVTLDVSSGFRFHPVEILLSFAFKASLVWLLALPAEALVIFEIILSGMAIFNHSNIQLPVVLEKRLRFLVVTPEMHRIHHSVIAQESMSNYGFNLSCWDRWCGTYQEQSRQPELPLKLGVEGLPANSFRGLFRLLKQPLVNEEQSQNPT